MGETLGIERSFGCCSMRDNIVIHPHNSIAFGDFQGPVTPNFDASSMTLF